jgi:hypothetical protein
MTFLKLKSFNTLNAFLHGKIGNCFSNTAIEIKVSITIDWHSPSTLTKPKNFTTIDIFKIRILKFDQNKFSQLFHIVIVYI